MTEKDWTASLGSRIESSLQGCGNNDWQIRVDAGLKLAYAHEIFCYEGDKVTDGSRTNSYETDLLICDINGEAWIPRVAIECKLRSVTTHDALTYSAKASTHKHVHPYLRYGILVGAFADTLPGRLIRHGAYFDFMMVWPGEEPSKKGGRSLSRF
jgi:hypothetical protein